MLVEDWLGLAGAIYAHADGKGDARVLGRPGRLLHRPHRPSHWWKGRPRFKENSIFKGSSQIGCIVLLFGGSRNGLLHLNAPILFALGMRAFVHLPPAVRRCLHQGTSTPQAIRTF